MTAANGGRWYAAVTAGVGLDRRRNRVGRLTFAVSYLVVLGLERVYRSAEGLAGASVQ